MTSQSSPTFRPSRMLRNAHLQTLIATYLPLPKPRYVARPIVVDLEDGDQIVLHEDAPEAWSKGGRIVVLMHGIGGSHLSSYMIRMAMKLKQLGYRVIRMDLRGHGAGLGLAHGFGHAGKSEDISAVVEYLIAVYPESPMSLIGFSMSGNILLKYLAECGEHVPAQLDSAAAVAAPIDLLHCGSNLRRGFNRVYDKAFVAHLKQMVVQRHRMLPDLGPISLHELPVRLWQFDDQYTAPRIGFAGVEDYYRQCSAGPRLHDVRTPTLLLVSDDDPLIPVSMFRRFAMNSAIDLQVIRHGGHMGFLASPGSDPDRHWMDWRLCDWIGQLNDRSHAVGSDNDPRCSNSASKDA